LIDESLVEHTIVKNLIGEIEAMDVGDELYDAKIRVLGEMVKHHIEEEEQELFPEVASTKTDLGVVGKELAKRKEELMAEMRLTGNAIDLSLRRPIAEVRYRQRVGMPEPNQRYQSQGSREPAGGG
jgi:hypothetical protein